MESPKEVKKVHDIYPDGDGHDDEAFPGDTTSTGRRPSVNGAINHARPRPFHVPRATSQSYPAYKGKQECALKIGIREAFDKEISKGTGISYLEVVKDKLTIHKHSQSKLSQQELSDLQKATHFDKKELQQWYKGNIHLPTTQHVNAHANTKT